MHPHADATYRVVAKNAGYGVEVSIPGSNPTVVSPFGSEDAAEDWIARHKERVASQASLRRPRFITGRSNPAPTPPS